MKAIVEIIELFEQFPKSEFAAETVVAMSYASDSATRRALKSLVDSSFLVYRYVETRQIARKMYRLKSVVSETTTA